MVRSLLLERWPELSPKGDMDLARQRRWRTLLQAAKLALTVTENQKNRIYLSSTLSLEELQVK